MKGNRKDDKRVCANLMHIFRKKPSKNRLTTILKLKMAKSVLGCEPSLPRQNTVALPIVTPPVPQPFVIPAESNLTRSQCFQIFSGCFVRSRLTPAIGLRPTGNKS